MGHKVFGQVMSKDFPEHESYEYHNVYSKCTRFPIQHMNVTHINILLTPGPGKPSKFSKIF